MPMDTDPKDGLKAVAGLFVGCCVSISASFYIGGFAVLEESNPAVSPIVTRLFKSFLATSLCYSWYYGFAVRLHVLKVPEFATSEALSIQILVANFKCLSTSGIVIFILVFHVCMIWPFCSMEMGVESTLSVFLILVDLYIRSTIRARHSVSLGKRLINSPSVAALLWRKRKILEFMLGMVGSILFQNFVKLASMEHVVAFLCFAVVWICSIVVIHPPTDFGILSFLLANVSLGCTVNIYGIKGRTWIVYAICVLLFWFHLKLMALSSAYTKFMEE